MAHYPDLKILVCSPVQFRNDQLLLFFNVSMNSDIHSLISLQHLYLLSCLSSSLVLWKLFQLDFQIRLTQSCYSLMVSFLLGISGCFRLNCYVFCLRLGINQFSKKPLFLAVQNIFFSESQFGWKDTCVTKSVFLDVFSGQN